jgi:hypothetical protein
MQADMERWENSPESITPAELAFLVGAYHGLAQRKAELNKLVEQVTSEGERLKRVLLKAMDVHSLTEIGGDTATVVRVPKKVPTVVAWDALYTHIRNTGEFDLLNKRVTTAAVEERWKDNRAVPGINATFIDTLSVRTATQKKGRAA